MTTTVWQGTIPANQGLSNPDGTHIPNAVVSFGFNPSGAEGLITIQNTFLLEPDSGYSGIQGYVTLVAGTGQFTPGTDLSTALSSVSPPLLQLDPSKTYTLTIAEN